jgi:NTP pyrophosphatase (non-canonical NTP hydrolase)
VAELLKDWQARVEEWVTNKLLPIAPQEFLSHVFCRKCQEELQEVILANEDGNLGEEIADTIITLLALAVVSDIDVDAELAKKLPILESGDWYYNTELGVFKRRKKKDDPVTKRSYPYGASDG